ncbi:related to sulfite oxidase and related enzymes [Cephalotrichum gorgonifer]|uniref:Related to sulfite oxidase and related enzymes n=1 Tax=Cephalotrichum gorgonifer TaxID=2041049 RepID=A0AAE8N3G2_9PEZI|nr:related to sulfite oxidase and related enzymes [Cephalotrichum gorgonifer]
MAMQPSAELDELGACTLPDTGRERDACLEINPDGFFIRHPPSPPLLSEFITAEDQLFQTIHMGAAVVDAGKWMLVVDGLVRRPFALSLPQLLRLPRKSVTAFHECYGSPLKPPTEAVWRIGNVTWTGVPLAHILSMACPLPEARYVWSEGLDRGSFFGVEADRYQKDLPLDTANSPEVLVAFEMNGEPLTKERGAPVRLVVPGWFGTNMTKWLCRLTLEDRRAAGPYTTTFYNEIDPADPSGKRKRPVWKAEVNSMIVRPTPDEVLSDHDVGVRGWAWCHEPVVEVQVTLDQGITWLPAEVETRVDVSWQMWRAELHLPAGSYTLMAQAKSSSGAEQPLTGRRNHVHTVQFQVI